MAKSQAQENPKKKAPAKKKAENGSAPKAPKASPKKKAAADMGEIFYLCLGRRTLA